MPSSRRCERCGCFLSRYSAAYDKFCWACHPKNESRPRLCAKGHRLSVHGVPNGVGITCGLCKQDRRK